MNPAIPEAFVLAELEKDPASASAEYLAEFRSDIEAFVSREAVESCVVPGRFELPPAKGRHFIGSIDPSGGAGQDSMTLAIAFRDGDVSTLAAIREWRPKFSPDQVAQEAAALLKSYKVSRCYADRFGGDWVATAFRKEGVQITYNDKSASELFIELLPKINSGTVALLDHPRLINQLCSLERKNTRSSSRPLIGHPPGQHDDLACAAATALVMATAKPPMIISDEALRLATQPIPWRTTDPDPSRKTVIGGFW